MSNQKWHELVRLVWISGGIVAANPPGSNVEVAAGVSGRLITNFKIPTDGSLYQAIARRGFLILGTTFLTSQSEIDGLVSPEFRTASRSGGWLLADVHQSWRQIAHAAVKVDDLRLLDLSSRIGIGLDHCEMRLHDLVSAYSIQLRYLLRQEGPSDYQVFKDANSPLVYKSIHALFWEMAVLRDTLAEFIAVYCLKRHGITTLSGLLKSVKKEPSQTTIIRNLILASDLSQEGWLAIFSAYRNFFTHVAPMEYASNIGFAIQNLRYLPDGTSMPQLYYPLPQNIEELSKKRAAGFPFSSFKEMAEASARKCDRAHEPDALEYLHACLQQMTHIAEDLISYSPIAPKPIVFGKDDIIGEIRTSISND